MTKAATSTRWFSAWRPAVRVVQDDPADLGTAFGLDMSMVDDAPVPPTPAPGRQAQGWAQRLGWRRPRPQA